MIPQKPKKPEIGESVSYLGRTLTHNADGTITSKRKGRDNLIHPNWTRAMDAIRPDPKEGK